MWYEKYMDRITSIFNSFYEYANEPLPNWLQWLIGLAVMFPFLKWGWSRYLADWYALRNQTRSKNRAIKLMRQIALIRDNRKNYSWQIQNAVHAIGLFVLSASMLSSFLAVRLVDILRGNDQEFDAKWLIVFGALAAYAFAWMGLRILAVKIRPCANYSSYTVKVGLRVISLMNMAGIEQKDHKQFMEMHFPLPDGTTTRDPITGELLEENGAEN